TEVDIDEVKELIAGAYAEGGTSEVKAADLESEDSAPIIQLTNRIIEVTYFSCASYIHVEPME
ncbi:MAG: hypothetical protein WCJ10_03815, partial [Opitutaceae bacterium]